MAPSAGQTPQPSVVCNSTFPLFSRLPPEIRLQIWQYALPDVLGPATFPFTHELRRLKRLTRSSPQHLISSQAQNNSDNSDVTVPSRPEKLDIPITFDTPIAQVNREGRQVVLSWGRKHAPRVRSVVDRGLVQRFDPDRDALYFDAFGLYYLTWHPRTRAPITRFPDLEPEWITHRANFKVSRYAVHEILLYWPFVFRFPMPNFDADGVLYVFCTDEIPTRTQNWEIGLSFGGAFSWEAKKAAFNFKSDGSMRLEEKMRWSYHEGLQIPNNDDTCTYWKGFEGLLDQLRPNLIAAGMKVDGYEVRPIGAASLP